MSLYLTVISYLMAGIVIMGIVTNSLSLTFFLQRRSPSPGTVLLISLNLVDMLVCVSSMATWIHSHWFLDDVRKVYPVSFQALIAISDIMIKTTVFITCLLTVTRTLYVVKPFFKIKTPCIMVLLSLFLCYEIIIVTLAFTGTIHFKYYWAELATLPTFLTILIVISGLTSIKKLLPNNLGQKTNTSVKRRRNVDTSITVLILAGLFCLFNIPFCVVHIWECILGPGSLYGSTHNYDTYVFIYSLCVPLNSAINPIVYFVRNHELRVFVVNKLCCGGGGYFSGNYWKGKGKLAMRLRHQPSAALEIHRVSSNKGPTSITPVRTPIRTPNTVPKHARIGEVKMMD